MNPSTQSDADELSGAFRSDTSTRGGSLQADSHVLWDQSGDCSVCMTQALAGPGNSLTMTETEAAGQGRLRESVVRVPLSGGKTSTLYKVLAPAATGNGPVSGLEIFADPSGQWVIAWPPASLSGQAMTKLNAGWISAGTLSRLPGTTLVFSNAIAW
jgi:hypothetical protein